MKKLLISAGALAATALSTPAFAATATSATANATVNIVSPLTLTNNTGLDFGTVVGPFAGQTSRIDTAGDRNCGGLTCSGTTVSAANFTVSGGTANQDLALTVDPSVSSDLGRQQPDRRPDDRSSDRSRDQRERRRRPSASAARSAIPAGTSDGVYSGTFNVTGRLPVRFKSAAALRARLNEGPSAVAGGPFFMPASLTVHG